MNKIKTFLFFLFAVFFTGGFVFADCSTSSYTLYDSPPSCCPDSAPNLCTRDVNGETKYVCMIVCRGGDVTGNSTWNDYEGEDGDGGGSTGGTSGSGLQNPIETDSFAELLESIADWILNIGLVLAPLMIVIGGIMFITAAGEPEKVKSAKNLLIYAAIGLIIILLAKSLVEIITNFIA